MTGQVRLSYNQAASSVRTTVNEGGQEVVYGGGTADFTTINGGILHVSIPRQSRGLYGVNRSKR